MAARRVPGRLDPNVELAAEAGDPASMRILGWHTYVASRGRAEQAEQWLLAAAEAGDAEAMNHLARVCNDRAARDSGGQEGRAAAAYWTRSAAEAGWVAAMESMASWVSGTPDEREFWLRRASDAGSPYSMWGLAEFLAEKEQAAEAEHWYRAAIDNGYTSARRDLATLLIGQDRSAEAEQYVRPEAEAGSSEAAGQLAELLARGGRTEEADRWRASVETLRDREYEAMRGQLARAAPGLADVALTAVVATALVPFLQALASRVAEDAYGQARQLVGRLLHRIGGSNDSIEEPAPSESAGDPEPGLAIVQDPDTDITLFLWSNASDEALRALSGLDLDELTLRRPDQGQVRLVWHPASGAWHIRGQ